MTAPVLAVQKPDGSRVYRHPVTGEEVPSVTTVLKMVAKPALVGWAARMAAQHACVNWPRLSGMPVRDRMLEISVAHEVYTQQKGEIGDTVHELIDAFMSGRPYPGWDKSIDPYVNSFLKFLTEHRPRFTENETTVWSRRYGYAGTLDFIAVIDGKTWLCDVKTGKNLHEEIGLQLAALAGADFILREDGTEEPLPHVDGVAGLHVRPRSWKFKPIPHEEECFAGFVAARELHRWQHETAPRLLAAA